VIDCIRSVPLTIAGSFIMGFSRYEVFQQILRGSGFIGLDTFDQALFPWLHSPLDPSSSGSISLGSTRSV
jgi:hypothetical protein